MITKLLNEINEEIKKLNHLLEDKQYLKNLEKRIEDINNRIDRTNRENERLHSIIKDARLYIYNHREPVDEKNQKIIYFLTDDFDEEDILEILDKEKNREV